MGGGGGGGAARRERDFDVVGDAYARRGRNPQTAPPEQQRRRQQAGDSHRGGGGGWEKAASATSTPRAKKVANDDLSRLADSDAGALDDVDPIEATRRELGLQLAAAREVGCGVSWRERGRVCPFMPPGRICFFSFVVGGSFFCLFVAVVVFESLDVRSY